MNDGSPEELPAHLQNLLHPSMTFKKLKGTTDEGRDFEDLTTASLLLNLTLDGRVRDFQLSANDASMGAIDDVVFEVDLIDGSKQKYGVQLKYANRKDKMLTKNSLQGNIRKDKSFSTKDGHFSLVKYHREYARLSKHLGRFKIILYTNRKFDISDKIVSGVKVEYDKNLIIDDGDDTLKLVIEEFQNDTFFDCTCYRFNIAQAAVGSARLASYTTFFEDFALCTTQMDVKQIKNSIAATFQKSFSLEEDIFNVCEKYIDFVKKWSLQEKTKTKIDKIFMRQVIALQLFTPYIQELTFHQPLNSREVLLRKAFSKFTITCLGENKIDKIRHFWSNVTTRQSNIGRIAKLYQITQNEVSGLEQLKNVDRSKLMWLLRKCPLLLLDNSITRKGIELCPELKYILLGKNFDGLPELPTFRYLVDLKRQPEVYNAILSEYCCHFQGKSVNLNSVIREIEEILTTDTLVLMMAGNLEIGGSGEILPQSHIDRLLSMNIISNDFLDNISRTAMVLISEEFDPCYNFNVVDLKTFLESNEDNEHVKICFSEEECPRDVFEALCLKAATRTCHQLRRLSDKRLEWVRSNGSINSLKAFITHRFHMSEADLPTYEKHNNVNIVCSNPGMGKSVLMRNLKNRSSSSFWTLMVNVRSHSRHFQANASGDLEDFKTYIIDEHKMKYAELDVQLLERLTRKGRVRYLWDGLDELSAQNLNTVKRIVQGFKQDGSKHWLTSRINLKKELEKEFCVISWKVEEFNENQQKQYIRDRLQCSEAELVGIFKAVNTNIRMYSADSVLGIPLQIYLLTELLAHNKEKYLTLLEDTFSIADLYHYFVDEKFQLFFLDKFAGDQSNCFASRLFNGFKTKQISSYEKVAVRAYFDNVTLDFLEEECQQILQELGDESDPAGFVVDVSEGNVPEFCHNSFGEFFTACYLSKHFTQIHFFKDLLFKEAYSNIRFFLDLILAKGCRPHIAVLYKNWAFLENCQREDFQLVDRGGRSPLHLLCSWGTKYKSLLIKKLGNTYYIYQDGTVPEKPCVDYIEILERLTKSCDPQQIDSLYGFNCFRYASTASCFLSLAVVTSKSGVVSRDLQDYMRTVLYYSVVFDYSNIFDVVKDIPPIKVVQDKRQLSLLHIALNVSISSFCKILSNNKTIKETKDPLVYEACRKRSSGVVKLLLDKGIDADISHDDGDLPLHVACRNGSLGTAKLLVENGVKVNAPGRFGLTPLHSACTSRSYKIVKLLLENGANIRAASDSGDLPIHRAAKSGTIEIMKYLMDQGADVNVCGHYGNTPLHIACKIGSLKMAKLLVENGCNLGIIDISCNTALHCACITGNFELVTLLISSGADVAAAGNLGKTALDLAVDKGHFDIVELLSTFPTS